MQKVTDSTQSDGGPESHPPPRIHTQIHRRSKAKADLPRTPLTNEWEPTHPSPPQNLKRLPRDMRKS